MKFRGIATRLDLKGSDHPGSIDLRPRSFNHFFVGKFNSQFGSLHEDFLAICTVLQINVF